MRGVIALFPEVKALRVSQQRRVIVASGDVFLPRRSPVLMLKPRAARLEMLVELATNPNGWAPRAKQYRKLTGLRVGVRFAGVVPV